NLSNKPMPTNTPEHVIKAEGICRSYGGTQALADFSLSLPRGSIYGFLGRNGAGKTTEIKILAGLMQPNAGTVRIFGKNPFMFGAADRQRLGYVSEKQILPLNLSLEALMRFSVRLYPRWDLALVERLVTVFDLPRRRRLSTLSQGAQRQAAFILAVAPKPEVLIL